MVNRRRALARLVPASLLLTSCGAPPDLPLTVENGTDSTVSVFVNGQQVGEFEPSTTGEVDAHLPFLPLAG